MTTMEKLLVQIFERKNAIIQQVKQQTELYSQHLASKLLIDGITPPSWLWNPNASSDSNELNREELISELLRPYPQPSASCSFAPYPLSDNLVGRGDNEEFSNGVLMENLAFTERVNMQDHPTVPPLSSEDRVECALNCVPDLDVRVTSPDDQTNKRVVNICNVPDQSLAGIQRSKSRQKAFHLRNSAKSVAKSGLSIETKPSVGLFRRVTRSQTRSNDKQLSEPIVYNENSSFESTMSKSEFKQKPAAYAEIQNTCSGQFGPSCFGTLDMLDEREHAGSFKVNKVGLGDPVNQSGSSNNDQKRELEFEVAPTASVSLMFEEPKHLNFNESEECNLKAFISNSGKQRLFNFAEKTSCSSKDPTVSLDKGNSVGINQLSLGKWSAGTLGISSEGATNRRDFFESEIQENPDNQAENFGPVIIGTMVNNFENKTEAGPNCNYSEVFCEADSIFSKTVDTPDIQIHPKKLVVEDGLQFLPKQHMEEGDWSGKVMDKSQLVSSATGSEDLRAAKDNSQLVSSVPESKNLRASRAYRSAKEPRESRDKLIGNVGEPDEIIGVLDNVKEFPSNQSQISSCLENGVCSQHSVSPLRGNVFVTHGTVCPPGEISSLKRKFRHASMESWPQIKRRRIEHQETRNLTNSRSFRVRKPHRSQRRLNIDTAVDPLNVAKHNNGEIPPEMISNLVEGIESTFSYQNKEVGFCYMESSEHKSSPSIINNEQFVTGLVSSLRKESIDSHGCFIVEISETNSSSNHSDARELGDGQISQNLCNLEKGTDHLSSLNSDLTDKMLEGVQYPQWESALHAQHSVVFPRTEDLELTNVDQSMPVLEGFIVDAQDGSGLLKFAADGIDLGKLELSSNSSSNHSDARELGDGQISQNLCNLEKGIDHLSSVNPDRTDTMVEELQFPQWESALHAQDSVVFPRTEDLELTDVDQSMPVLEGFIVDAQEGSGLLEFAEDGIDFGKLDLSSSTIERASILAEICRSASMDKSLSHFSSAFEFEGNQNLYQSVPSDHLQHTDLASSLASNSDICQELHSGKSSVDDFKEALEGMAYSDCYGVRYAWNSRSQHLSPVGKLRERLSSHIGSSGKRLSSNPELTCFPIEEDVSISEEQNKTVGENKGDVDEEIDSSLAKHSHKRLPLKELTNLDLNPSMSVSVNKKTSMADSVDFVGTKLSVTGTRDMIQSGTNNHYKNKRETSEKQSSSISTNNGRKNQSSLQSTKGIKKAKESVNGSIRKSVQSIRAGLKRQDQKLSLKDASRNNIISNISSFIPLVQQKQAAAVCAGKRDVKVKALEAAEASKRLEEKKENERKMRKEALKLERAKLEEKNLRQLELEKKKKEEERVKKDADIIARKRQREDEEKKEKEKKRMRLEARYQQKEQGEKMRAVKAQKQNRWSKDDQMNSKKEFLTESKKQQNNGISRDDMALKREEIKSTITDVVMNYEQSGTSGQSCEVGKGLYTMDKSPRNEDLIVRDGQGKSYDISPYQCSDDEDEEDDELPTKKYIPSWASKTSIGMLLPLQQGMDPDTIFPRESFCTMEEVLLPRKRQQKQMAG